MSHNTKFIDCNIGDIIVVIGNERNNNSNAPGYNKDNTYKSNTKYTVKNIHLSKWAVDYGYQCTIETECGKFIRTTIGSNVVVEKRINPIYEIY